MQALTIWQPFASLVVHGHKRIETRSWRTHFRGWLLIHAGVVSNDELRELSAREPFQSKLAPLGGYDSLPRGAILGGVFVRDCVRVEALEHDLSDQERAFGWYDPGRYGWLLDHPVALDEPVACKGSRQVWTPDHEAMMMVQSQLSLLTLPDFYTG